MKQTTKRGWRRRLSVFLAATMVVGILPMTAFAGTTTELITNGDFEGETLSWVRNYGDAYTASDVVEDPLGTHGKALHVQGRWNMWSAPGYQLTGLEVGKTYKFSADVMYNTTELGWDALVKDADGNNVKKEDGSDLRERANLPTSERLNFQLQLGENSANAQSYKREDLNVQRGVWSTISFEIEATATSAYLSVMSEDWGASGRTELPEGYTAPAGAVGEPSYLEENVAGVDFYLDNVSVTTETEEPETETNLINDGNMDADNTNAWTCWGGTITKTTDPANGDHGQVLLISDRGGATVAAGYWIQLQAGVTYKLSADVYTATADVSEERDTIGFSISVGSDSQTIDLSKNGCDVPLDQWTTIGGTFTPVADFEGWIWFQTCGDWTSYNYYLDNVKLVKLADADSTKTATIEFMGGSLRKDYPNDEPNYTYTSLRFGYRYELPSGADITSCWCDWKTDAMSSTSRKDMVNKMNASEYKSGLNGTITNLVFKNITNSNFDKDIHVTFHIEFKCGDNLVKLQNVTQTRSVSQVIEGLIDRGNASDKEYAESLKSQM